MLWQRGCDNWIIYWIPPSIDSRLLRYFNFAPSFKVRWCRARDFTGGFELRIFCIRSSYLTHQALKLDSLGRFGVPEFATLRQEWLIYVETLQLRTTFQTAMVSCSRFIWISSSSESQIALYSKSTEFIRPYGPLA